MAAGHIVANQCVVVAASSDYYFSSALPTSSVTLDGAFVFQTMFRKLTNGWSLSVRQTKTSDGTFVTTNSSISPPAFATCDTKTAFTDGGILGAGVVLAMVVAWAIHVLRRGL